MNCGQARKLFGSYWDDEITLAERDWLESHFAACEACRREYESLARTLELVGTLPRAEVRPGLAERALARARRAAPAPDRLPVGTPRWIPVTATAALLAIAATMVLQWMGVTPGGRVALRPEPAAVRQPVLVQPASAGRVGAAAPAPAAPLRGAEPLAGAPSADGAPDSLFDHSADLEFILDPVTLRKGRAHTVLRLSPSVQGEKAVITF